MGNNPSRHHELGRRDGTVFLSQEGQIYRIPALVYDADRRVLLAFAEKRKTPDDSSTLELVMKTGNVQNSADQEVTVEWSEQKTVTEAHLEGHRPMNPCPVYDTQTRTLFLFFICVEDAITEQYQLWSGRNKARLLYTKTNDSGQTWSEATDLTDSLPEIEGWATFAVGPGHGIQTEKGKLIVPVYGYGSCSGLCCCIGCNCSVPRALCLHSDDGGSTWKFSNMLQEESLECEVAELSDGSIYCNARSRTNCNSTCCKSLCSPSCRSSCCGPCCKGWYRVEAVSKNDGKHFQISGFANRLVETGAGCQGSVISFPGQPDPGQNQDRWLLFSHPTSEINRIDLGVYLNESPLDPKSAWSKPWIINPGPSGYSDLAYVGQGWFVCLMERGEKTETEQIAFEVFSYDQVRDRNRK